MKPSKNHGVEPRSFYSPLCQVLFKMNARIPTTNYVLPDSRLAWLPPMILLALCSLIMRQGT